MNNQHGNFEWKIAVACGALLIFAAAYLIWRNDNLDFGISSAPTDARIAAGIQRRQQEMERWAWLKTAEPTQMLRQDIRQKRFRFLQVCGYSCQTVGMDDILIDQCYPGMAREAIAPPGDAVSHAARALQERAYVIAQAYNRRMTAYLDAHGMRKCAKTLQAHKVQ